MIDAVTRLIAIPILRPELRFRAGISYGEFYHDSKKNIYVGKALIEAHDLQIKQQWCGGALTEIAEERIGSYYYLTKYSVPIGRFKKISRSAINWTLAKHDPIGSRFKWLSRDYSWTSTKDLQRVERYLKNTERFHFEKCVQCRAFRKSLREKRRKGDLAMVAC